MAYEARPPNANKKTLDSRPNVLRLSNVEGNGALDGHTMEIVMGRHKMYGFAKVSGPKPAQLSLGSYMLQWLDEENVSMFFLKANKMCPSEVKSFLGKAQKTNIAKWRSEVATFWVRVRYTRNFKLVDYPLFTGSEVERDHLIEALCRTLQTPDKDGFDLDAFVSSYLRENPQVDLEKLMIDVL